LKVGLRLVERRAGQAKLAGGLGQGVLVLFQSAQAFVLELKQVLGIEKLRSLKERVSYPGMVRVEGAGGLEGLTFGVGAVGWHKCKRIYAA